VMATACPLYSTARSRTSHGGGPKRRSGAPLRGRPAGV